MDQIKIIYNRPVKIEDKMLLFLDLKTIVIILEV